MTIGGGGGGGAGVVASLISRKASLLFRYPLALVMVSRPSATVTVFVAVTNRLPVVGVPLSASTPSALNAYLLSKYAGSPATSFTAYVPFGSAISHALPLA